MSYQNENFGMMDQGYFVPRTQILAWINGLLNLNLTKIQQLGSGAVYCQIVDVIHPGKVGLQKINWKARNDYEFISNLKILQNAFDKIGIKRHVQVQRLAKAKYQDNLQFIQWLKRYYDLNCGQRGNNYMPDERRGNAAVDFSFAEKNVVPKTYNSHGVVKSQVFQEKKPAPKQQQPARVKSPVVKNEIKKTTTASTVTRPQAKKAPVQKKQKTPAFNESEYQQKIQNLSNELSQRQEQNAALKDQVDSYALKIKSLQSQVESSQGQQNQGQGDMKIQMIRQILKGQDEAEMKINLIQEIIKE